MIEHRVVTKDGRVMYHGSVLLDTAGWDESFPKLAPFRIEQREVGEWTDVEQEEP